MEYGSIFGHGAYLGPDFTDDYLHRAALSVKASTAAAASDGAEQRTIDDFQANRYDSATNTLTLHRRAGARIQRAAAPLRRLLRRPDDAVRPAPDAITDPQKIKELTAFFSWSAWAAAARRPGHNYSYTNNWPPEKLVGNTPTANVLLWSVVSLIALLGGIGLLFGAFGRWNFLGWRGTRAGDALLPGTRRGGADARPARDRLVLLRDGRAVPDPDPGRRRLPALPCGPGRLLRRRPCPGLPLQPDPHLPCAARDLLRLDLLPCRRDLPGSDDRQARAQRQGTLAYILLAAVAIVVFGSLIGEFAGVHGWLGGSATCLVTRASSIWTSAGFWQVLLVIGLFFWVAILYRGLRGRLSREHVGNMPWLFFFAALAIPAFYAVGLLADAGRASPSPTSGASGSSTSGWRTSSSCSRR